MPELKMFLIENIGFSFLLNRQFGNFCPLNQDTDNEKVASKRNCVIKYILQWVKMTVTASDWPIWTQIYQNGP